MDLFDLQSVSQILFVVLGCLCSSFALQKHIGSATDALLQINHTAQYLRCMVGLCKNYTSVLSSGFGLLYANQFVAFSKITFIFNLAMQSFPTLHLGIIQARY